MFLYVLLMFLSQRERYGRNNAAGENYRNAGFNYRKNGI